MPDQIRLARMEGDMQRVLSLVLLEEVRDDRMARVTVTRVKLAPDLSFARVFVSPIDEPTRQSATLESLNRAKGFFKRCLADRMALRLMPELAFEVDRNIEAQLRVDEVIRELRRHE